jgi:hypothetical protein
MRPARPCHEDEVDVSPIASQPMRKVRPTKSYRVEWIGEPGAAVAAFDHLQTAIQYIGELHRDQQHIVICRGEVIWPDNVRRSCAPPQLGHVE